MGYEVSGQDWQILRELAKKQFFYANQECNLKRREEWYRHNELQGERPLIHLEMGTFEQEILPERMRCMGDFARQLERALYCNFLNQELFDDDRVTPDYFAVGYDSYFTLFGLQVKVQGTKDAEGKTSVGHHFISQIEDLEEDWDKVGETQFGVNPAASLERKAAVEEVIGDILPVRLEGNCLYSVPTQMVVHLMSMETMMFSMYDYPELFKEMMERITDDTLAYYRLLEKEGLILPTTGGGFLGQGSWCYNHTLPDGKAPGSYTAKDVWGFMDSQETVGISPEMFEEFIFPCYKKISESYGLLSYGCCEPVGPIWENCISRLENLRKVSISPWCNEEYMGERLRGSRVIYHRKPSPNYLGTGTVLDEEAFRAHIRKSLKAAKGCEMEITQRDVYTINRDIPKALHCKMKCDKS